MSPSEFEQMGATCVAISKAHFMNYFNDHKDPTQLAVFCASDGFLAGMTFMEARMKAALAANVLDKPQQEG